MTTFFNNFVKSFVQITFFYEFCNRKTLPATSMNIKNFVALSLLAAFCITACKNEPKSVVEERVIQDTDPSTGVISLRDYTLTDTITVDGKGYRYTYSLEHVDSMPVVINPQGTEYHESRVHIAIKRGEEEVFNKTFYKNNFREHIPANFLKTSTMVGVSYNENRRGEPSSALYFIVTIGDPDETSDMVYPLELKVAPDGSYSLKKAENLETESMNPSLNVDPVGDGV